MMQSMVKGVKKVESESVKRLINERAIKLQSNALLS